MGMIDFDCQICKTAFKADEYNDSGVNQCPKCGQVYNYDEGPAIVLTEEQRNILGLNWCSL